MFDLNNILEGQQHINNPVCTVSKSKNVLSGETLIKQLLRFINATLCERCLIDFELCMDLFGKSMDTFRTVEIKLICFTNVEMTVFK